MRPLPRLHAITDARVLARPDLAVRAAALASAGPAVALHARDRSAGGAALVEAARRLGALARPAEAALFVNARPDIAAALDAQGVQLGPADLRPAEVRRAFAPWNGWIGASVHSLEEADQAVADGADFLVAGSVFESSSHPGRPPAGLGLVSAAARLGPPVIAIGGVSPERARLAREAGAWGVAVISAAWDAPDSAAAALALLAPWMEDS